MQLTKTVEVAQGRYDAVERAVVGYNSKTQEEGTFKTAEEHGCRPLSCRQHWEHVPLPPKYVSE